RCARELDEVALLQELREERAVTGECRIRALQERLQKLLRGPLSRDDFKALLDVVAYHLGRGNPEFPRRSRLHQWLRTLQELERLFRQGEFAGAGRAVALSPDRVSERHQ